MDDIAIQLLHRLSDKTDEILQKITQIEINKVEQDCQIEALGTRYGKLEKKISDLSGAIHDENNCQVKHDLDKLYERVRVIEAIPSQKLKAGWSFFKKAIFAGVSVLITGAVVVLGKFLWAVLRNLDTLVESIEKLR